MDGASGLSLLISAYSYPSSPDSSDHSSNVDSADSEPEDSSKNDTTSQDSQDEVYPSSTVYRTGEGDMFERYESAIDTPPDSLKNDKSSPSGVTCDGMSGENLQSSDSQTAEVKYGDLSDNNPSSLSQEEDEFILSGKAPFSRNDSVGSLASSLRDQFHQEDSMSSLSQDSDTWTPQRYDSALSSSSTPLIKEEVLEYTDGAGQYFYVPPDDSPDTYKPDAPTYLHEQEFTSLSSEIKGGTVWNRDDSVFSSILHNVGLVHKDAAADISKLPSLQRSKLSVLLKSWSNEKAFTDCLVDMTDCDHFYDPIGYDTVLVTDPCMSAKYDTLANGLNHLEVERKQMDEFYNFTEEKSFFFQKCKMCSKLFSNTFGLRQHIAHTHPNVSMDDLLRKDEGLFPCVKCKRTFNSQGQLKKHFQKAHIPKVPSSDMNYKCSHCGEHFKTSVLLHRHTSDKHRNRTKTEAAELHEPWSCELCKSIFYKKSNFLKHMQKVHGKMKVSERLLNSAKLSAQLSAHLISPGGRQSRDQAGSPRPTRAKDKEEAKERKKSVKKLDLPDDSDSKTSESAKPRSKSREKKNESVELPEVKERKPSEINVTCLFCKLCFVSYTDLQLHCADVHREANKIILLKMFTKVGSQPHGINFQCILCDKVCPTPPVALGHLESVHLHRECDVKNEESHSDQVSRPPGEEPPSSINPQLIDFDGLSLMCRFCNKIFKNSKVKRKHEKTVHNDQTIVCFYCFIPILNRTELTKHIKTEHSGSKSLFKCRWCDAHFTSIPKRCTHMKDFHSSDVANITNRSSQSTDCHDAKNEPVEDRGDAPKHGCDKCNLSFPNHDVKLKHDKDVHSEPDSSSCMYCFASFKNRESLIQHIAVYHQSYHKRPYKCKWCEITFETLYQRRLHMKHSHDVVSISDNNSPQQKNTDTSVDENFLNVSTESGEKSSLAFSGKSLQQSFSQFPKETSKLVRKCKFCDAEVTSMILKKHLIKHRQWDHFVCIFCGKTVPTIGGIKSHILRNHPFITTRKMDRSELGSKDLERVATIERMHNSSVRRGSTVGVIEPPSPRITPDVQLIFPCQVCFFLFSIDLHVQDHWKIHSNEANEEWTCTLCDEQYGEFKSFKFHIEMHQNDAFTFAQSTVELQNICSFCDITIETQQALDGHVLIHRSVDHFNCVFCKCKSNTFRDMKAHISQNHMNADSLPNDPSRHLNETPFNSSTFKCSICLKLCNNQFNLNSHTKAHILGGKPCNLCNFKFKDMSALKNHLLLIHRASEDYISAIECKAASRSDAVADYCELCDTSFSSQGKFQKHRKACRDKFKSMNSTSQDNNNLYSLLENGHSPIIGEVSTVKQLVSETVLESAVNGGTQDCAVKTEPPLDTHCEDMNQGSFEELESLPMEIPIKSTDDGSLCPQLSISPHSYNTRKRPRPDSYNNIVPAKLLNLSYLGYPRSSFPSQDTPARKLPVLKPKPPPVITSPPVGVEDEPPKPPLEPLKILSVESSTPNRNSENIANEEVYCDVCELNFTTNKQLYWHKHTKRHLAMEILAKGAPVASQGKHPCDQCDQGYNCKKQLRWHKKITHEENTNLADIVHRQLPQSRVGVPRFQVQSEFLPSKENQSSEATACSGPNIKQEPEDLSLKSPRDEVHPDASDLITDESDVLQSSVDESDASQLMNDSVDNDVDNQEASGAGGELSLKERSGNGDQSESEDVVNGQTFYCELCKLSYKSNKQLYNHKRTLSHIQLARMHDPSFTEVYYTCEECNVDFQSYKQLWNHKRSLQHKEIADTIIQNPPAKPEGVTNGEGNQPPELQKNFVCLDCDCVFEDKKQMKWHKKTWNHKTITIVPPPNGKTAEEKPAPPPREPRLPDKCSRGTLCAADKPCKYHEAKNEKAPYNCQECNLPFRALRSYTVHCKQHLKEGFKCTVCNQKFQFKNYNNVKRHLTNIHKVAGDKTKNYMETFHDFDQNAQPLTAINPADLMEAADSSITESNASVTENKTNGTHDSFNGASSPTSNSSSSHTFIEGLLNDVGLTLQMCERKQDWDKPSKCKFCKVDFENVPEMLMHVTEDHDRNFHKQFLASFVNSDDASSSVSSEEESDDSCGPMSGPKDQSLSDIELDDGYSSPDSDGEHVTPSIRIKRPAGDSLSNGSSKRPKLGFGLKSSTTLNPSEPISEALSTNGAGPDEGPSVEDMFSSYSPKRQYSCILCNTCFTVYLAWWYHSKTEHDFSNVNYYGGSADSKAPGTPYESATKKNVKAECPDCHAIFNQRLLLEAHLKSHRKPKIFQCDFCCKKFNSCKNASRHRLKCHCIVVNGKKRFLCKLCEENFPRANDLIEHVQEKHDTASSTFCCATCGKVYNKESTFVAHIRGCDPDSASPPHPSKT